jgi:hypothetical protein
MREQSHRDEMSAAIRAQRERQAVPRSIAPDHEPPPQPEPPQEPQREEQPRGGFLERLRRK